ncbi:MAG: hypothetical protein ACRELB_20895 [Polyangiaceae bacterium]
MQLRSDGAVRCTLGCGEPRAVVPGVLGPVALFEPDELVSYVIRSPAGRRLFVFRTLAVDDKWAASVPGVHPRVRLLVHARSAKRVWAMKRLFAYIAVRSMSPSDLSDGFYTRVSHLLGGRTDGAHLRALVRRELARREGRANDAATEGRP